MSRRVVRVGAGVVERGVVRDSLVVRRPSKRSALTRGTSGTSAAEGGLSNVVRKGLVGLVSREEQNATSDSQSKVYAQINTVRRSSNKSPHKV